MLSQPDAFIHRNFDTHTDVADGFAKTNRYTDNVLHTNEFYTQKLSNGETCTKNNFDT